MVGIEPTSSRLQAERNAIIAPPAVEYHGNSIITIAATSTIQIISNTSLILRIILLIFYVLG